MDKSASARWGIDRRWFVLLAVLAVAPFAAPAVRAVDYVNDPLTAPDFAGRGSRGGTFSDSGWTVTGEADAVWYEIGEALTSGRVEYTVTGLSLATSLTGVDHDILTLYQAPTGMAEPVPYSPFFRNNDFKVFTRIFGTGETGRPGAMKLELAFCPRGEPWYHDDACTPECDRSGLAYGGSGGDLGWDAAASYRMAVAWGGERMAFYRDGVEVGVVPYPGEWAPQPLRVRLGSPRHDGVYPGQAMMPLGITIRDVLIQGEPGARTPACGADAGTDAGADGDADADVIGPPDGDGGGGEFSVLADVTAASWEAGVFPDVTDLNIEADEIGGPVAVVYLRFPAVSGTISRAVLRLHTRPESSAAGGGGRVCAVADDTWDETTVTWATRPAVGVACTGSVGSVDPDAEVVWDVTALVAAGVRVNLALVSNDLNGAHCLSKEAGDPALAPRLLVEAAPGVDGGDGTSDEDAAGEADGAGASEGGPDAGTDADAARDAARDAALPVEEAGGCGCRAAGSFGPAPALALLGLLALVVVARRGRRG
ncbi:MAG: DNRLRE domain-containing protein [Deltaproteobacteria bacterium]|nr:DNRLRE domain-containing protein [Deltaproteobacteria bacterium]